jgi:hypothetical protein
MRLSPVAKGSADQVGIPDQEPLQRTNGALALTVTSESADTTVVSLPRLLRDLTEIERYVLARAAVHRWTQDSSIPYVPSNAHQQAVAQMLAAAEVKLLDAVVTLECRQAYRLSRRGEAVARRVFRLRPMALLKAYPNNPAILESMNTAEPEETQSTAYTQ